VPAHLLAYFCCGEWSIEEEKIELKINCWKSSKKIAK
jgi:hypothetical protein